MALYGYSPPRPPDRPRLRSRRPRRPPVYQHSPGVGTMPTLTPPTYSTPYQHSPGVGTMPSPSVVGGGPPPATPVPGGFDPSAQTQQIVQSLIDPQLRYITDLFGRRASATQSAFGSATDSYAGLLSGLAGQVPGIFGPSKAIVSGAASGLNQQLTGLGASTAATEKGAAKAAQQPVGGQSPDINLKQEGKGAGGAAGAIGDAMIQSLVSAQNAAMHYAEQLPGFARAEGGQQLNLALASLSAQMADQLAQTTAQIPQLYFQIYNQLLDRAQQDREWEFQLRQYADQQRAARSQVVGPQAPTTMGRLAYWQGVAKERTASQGQEWMGTTTGLRPVDADPTRPGIQPALTLAGRAEQRQELAAQKVGVGKPQRVTLPNGQTGLWDPTTNTITLARGTNPAKPPKAPAAPKQPTNTGPYYRNPVTKKWELRPGYKIVNGEVVTAKNPKATTTVSGSAPRRVAPGKWQTASGRPLSRAASAYWERMWREGRTDGHGSLKPPPKPKTTATSGTKPPGLQ